MGKTLETATVLEIREHVATLDSQRELIQRSAAEGIIPFPLCQLFDRKLSKRCSSFK